MICFIIIEMKIKVAGCDIGGTRVKLCLYDGEKFFDERLFEINPEEDFLEEIIEFLNKIEGLKAIGFGIPGVIEEGNILRFAPNLPFLFGKNLDEVITDRLKVKKVFFDNDCHMNAYGEWKLGKAKGLECFIFLTLGTGVGGAVFIEGKLFRGYKNLGAEFGHVTVDPDGPVCNCGNKGCLEAFASKTGIRNFLYKKKKEGVEHILTRNPLKVEPEAVYEMAKKGDTLAVECFKNLGWALGIALSDFAKVFSPQKFIIGGGISNAFEIFYPFILEEYSLRVPHYLLNIKIEMADLKDKAGMYGASLYAYDSILKEK
ncbi:MAG: ROK family protein [candidate division WOR-3 bacterium]